MGNPCWSWKESKKSFKITYQLTNIWDVPLPTWIELLEGAAKASRNLARHGEMHPAPVAWWTAQNLWIVYFGQSVVHLAQVDGIWMDPRIQVNRWQGSTESTSTLASSAFPCHWMSCVVAFDLPKMQNVQRIEDELIDVCLTAARKLDGLPWASPFQQPVGFKTGWTSSGSTVQSFQIIEAKRWVWQYSEAKDQDSLGQWRTETAMWNFWVGSFANVVKSETLLQLHLRFYKDLQFMIHLPTSANMMNMGLSNWNHPPFWRKIHIFQLAICVKALRLTRATCLEPPAATRNDPSLTSCGPSCGPQPKSPPDQVEAP